MRGSVLGASALALLALPLTAAAPPASPASVATCTSPVRPTDTAASLVRRFGRLARIERHEGAEGEVTRIVALYPRDPARRLEVAFFDEALRQPSSISTNSANSVWSMGGLRMGDSLDKVNRLNGGAFVLYGFDWDYGGTVQNWGNGALERAVSGCMLSARFGYGEGANVPESLLGDNALRSDLPAMRRLQPRVREVSLNWSGGQ